jgi:hypothetical protein
LWEIKMQLIRSQSTKVERAHSLNENNKLVMPTYRSLTSSAPSTMRPLPKLQPNLSSSNAKRASVCWGTDFWTKRIATTITSTCRRSSSSKM